MGAVVVGIRRAMRLPVVVVLFAAALAFALSTTVFAHPGRTDSSGGHYDRETGEYHYHHGFEAHQHVNGECPFDFVDLTGQNSGGGASSNKADSSHIVDPNSAERSEKEIPFMVRVIMAVMISPIAFCALLQAKFFLLHVLKIEQDDIDWTAVLDWASSVFIIYGLISPGGIHQNGAVMKLGIAFFIASVIARCVIKIRNHI